MSWQILLVISILTSSVTVLLQRILLHNDKSDPAAYAVVFQAIAAGILTICALLNGFIWPDFDKYWFAISATILLFAVGNVMYAKALKQVEASIFTVILATSSIWVMLISVFVFHEHLSPTQIVGALLIFTSVGLLADRTGKLRFDRGLIFSLLCGVIYGLAISAWVHVAKHSDLLSWDAIAFAGPAILIVLFNPRSVSKMKPFLSGGIMHRMLLLGVIFSVASLSLLGAYKYGSTSVVSPLQQTGIVLTIVLAIVFLRERANIARKLVAALVCFVGVVLIVS